MIGDKKFVKMMAESGINFVASSDALDSVGDAGVFSLFENDQLSFEKPRTSGSNYVLKQFLKGEYCLSGVSYALINWCKLQQIPLFSGCWLVEI